MGDKDPLTKLPAEDEHQSSSVGGSSSPAPSVPPVETAKRHSPNADSHFIRFSGSRPNQRRKSGPLTLDSPRPRGKAATPRFRAIAQPPSSGRRILSWHSLTTHCDPISPSGPSGPPGCSIVESLPP